MALPTSGTYNFLSSQAALLIDQAFQKLGKRPTELVPYDIYNATTEINLIVLDWVNRGINLWLLEKVYLSLARYQATYTLDISISDIIQANTRTFTRALGATPASFTINRTQIGAARTNTADTYDNGGGGVPNNAFDGNLATLCTQNVADGNISFDYGAGNTRTVTSFGIYPIAATSLVIECNNINPNTPGDWVQIGAIAAPTLATLNTVNIALPQAARYYRVREIGGDTLNVAEVYFNTGIAANAFDGNPATACIQQDPNGVISYNYDEPIGTTEISPTVINFIGITSNITATYTINVRASILDDGNYITILSIPAQTYTAGVTVWLDIDKPVSALYYDIIEVTTEDPIPLNIQEIYFTNNIFDIPISNAGRYSYFTFTNKNIEGRPSNYYFNKQIVPELTLWPVPAAQFQVLQLSVAKLAQDAGRITNGLQIPPLFYPALVDALAAGLASDYRPELEQSLSAKAERTFGAAYANNTENVPLTIQPEWRGSVW